MQLYRYNGQVTQYSISETGELYNTKTQKYLKGAINAHGYRVYRISIDGQSKDLYAHRMVAETYVPCGDPKKNCVNHIDGNKLNNSVANLEWVTKSENNRHAVTTGLNPLFKEIYCFNKQKELVATFTGLAAAARFVNGTDDNISQAARAEKKSLTYGYYWNETASNQFDTVTKIGGGRKPVARYSLAGELLEKYETITEASRLTGYPKARISAAAHGQIKTYRGYIWKFL